MQYFVVLVYYLNRMKSSRLEWNPEKEDTPFTENDTGVGVKTKSTVENKPAASYKNLDVSTWTAVNIIISNATKIRVES